MTGDPFYRTPEPVLLASRTMTARHESACARCGRLMLIGDRIGLIDELGWCHVVPCIVSPVRQEAK